MSKFVLLPKPVPKHERAIFNDDMEGPSELENKWASGHYTYWLAQRDRAQESVEIGSYALANNLSNSLEEYVTHPDGEIYLGRRCQLMGVLALSVLCQRIWGVFGEGFGDAVGSKHADIVVDSQFTDFVVPPHAPRVHLTKRVMDEHFGPKESLQTTKPLWYEDTSGDEPLYVRRMQRFLPSPEVQMSMANRGVGVDAAVMETVFPYIAQGEW